MDRHELYFGYGSNLNEAELRTWCRRNRLVFPFRGRGVRAFLPDMELGFNYRSSSRGGGALNLVDRFGQAVPGVLFTVVPGGWQTLDRKEGASSRSQCYDRKKVVVLLEEGRQISAVTYIAGEGIASDSFVQPAPGYLGFVEEGLEAYGLDDSMLKHVAGNRAVPWTVAKLFAYGTLMQGESLHHNVAYHGNLLSIRRACVRGRLVDMGKYPGMLPAQGGTESVVGELLEMRDVSRTLKVVDEIEGFLGWGRSGSLYRRALVRARTDCATEELAWTYFLAKQVNGPLIESGDWRSRQTT